MSKVLISLVYYIINVVGKKDKNDIEYILKYVSLVSIGKREFAQ